MCLQEKIHFFFKAIFPTTTTVDKSFPDTGENSWWKALLQLVWSEAASGYQMSELLRQKSFSPPISPAQCLEYDGLPTPLYTVCWMLQWGQEMSTTQPSDTCLWKGNASPAEQGLIVSSCPRGYTAASICSAVLTTCEKRGPAASGVQAI